MGGGRGGKEWNGGFAGEHVRRENAIHTQTRGVCVCVYMCLRAKGKAILNRGGGGGDAAEAEGYPVPQGGGRIHHDVHYLLKYKST